MQRPKTCLILQGEVTVTPSDGDEAVRRAMADLVTVPAYLPCTRHGHSPGRKPDLFS